MNLKSDLQTLPVGNILAGFNLILSEIKNLIRFRNKTRLDQTYKGTRICHCLFPSGNICTVSESLQRHQNSVFLIT